MDKEINIQELIGIVWRRWWLVAIMVVVFGASFFTYNKFMVPEQFTSYGSVYVSNKAPQVITSYTDNNTANLYDLTTSNMLVDTYKAILSTNNFFENIKKNVDIPYGVDTLKTMVRYDSIEETGIIQVYATAFSPEEAQKLCAAVLEYANYTIMDIVEAGSVKTIDDATLPKGHSYPNVTRNTLLGMILGGFLACAIILLIYYFDVKINSVEEIESRTGLVVLGAIPNIDAARNSRNGGHYGD